MVEISSVPSDKKTQGRRKIEIKPLKDKSSRQQVTFSKRRSGLFKKAGELAILCESALAIIVFSPGRKAFFFGHPNPNTVIDHFLGDSSATNTIDATLPDNLHELNKQYAEAVRELEAEKRRGKELVEENRAESGGEFWWERPVADDVGMEELEFYMAALQELKSNVEKKLDDMVTVRHIHREVPDALEAAGTSRSHAGVLNRFARQAGAGPAGDGGGGLGYPADLLKGGLGHFVYGQGHV